MKAAENCSETAHIFIAKIFSACIRLGCFQAWKNNSDLMMFDEFSYFHIDN